MKRKHGFSMIEIIVVTAIIILLLAVLLPALIKAREQVKIVNCSSNLKQQEMAVRMYQMDNDDKFYQGKDADILYAEWKGKWYPNEPRPLNSYLGMDKYNQSKNGIAEVCKCPSDKGSIVNPINNYFEEIGTSYRANKLLMGQDQIGLLQDKSLTDALNKQLPNLTRNRVTNPPAKVPLLGDSEWDFQWLPLDYTGKSWHGKKEHFNLVFLDGHTELIEVFKDVYICEKYKVVPFKAVNSIVRDLGLVCP